MSDYEDAVDSLGDDGSLSSGRSSEGGCWPPSGVLRKRRPPLEWDDSLSIGSDDPGLQEVKELLEANDSELDEDLAGCPLPSTPLELPPPDEMREVLKDLGALMCSAREPAEIFVRKVWEASWSVCHFRSLPHWLQDNDYLHHGHRPQLDSFSACIKSIFRIHTETGNIWTHLLGCLVAVAMWIVFMMSSSEEITWGDKLAHLPFFLGLVICLFLSTAFHTVSCHSEGVGKLFSKLDYCGIALLITGSFVPWLYYGFYCRPEEKAIYITGVLILGSACIIVSLWDKFSHSRFRPIRAGVFAAFGLSGVIPAMHYGMAEGWMKAFQFAALGELILMGSLYIIGALIYALRIPECLFPGKFDLLFHSHQIFHSLVLLAASVHYHGITQMATYRMTIGDCTAQTAAIVF